MYGASNDAGVLTSKANESSWGSLNLPSSIQEPVTTKFNHKDLGAINRGGKKIDHGNPNKSSTVGAHMLNMNSHEP